MSTPDRTLREKFIAETEQVINRKREAVERLLAEAEILEAEISEARGLLKMLKANGTTPEPEAKAEAKTEEEKPRKKLVRLTQEELLGCLQSLGPREFTSKEAAQVTGYSQTSMASVLRRFEKAGLAKEVRKAEFIPGKRSEPARWRVTAIKH